MTGSKDALVVPFVAALLAAPPALAQVDPVLSRALPAARISAAVPEMPPPHEAYGPNTQESWFLGAEFTPYDSTAPWDYTSWLYYSKSTGGGSSNYGASVNLPNGALVANFCAYFYDADATYDASAAFYKYIYDVSSNNNTAVALATVTTTGSGGYLNACSALAAPETIRHDDGNLRNSYVVVVTMPTSANVAFRMARLDWQRQVSPAPATATFGDVPTTSPFFAYVEALYASGVVAGCGGGNYCPTNPVTRGQMAVYLARALGMHWPQ